MSPSKKVELSSSSDSTIVERLDGDDEEDEGRGKKEERKGRKMQGRRS